MATVIVEYAFDPPATDADVDAARQRLKPCQAARNVTWKMSFMSEDRRHQFCVFEAADAQVVREAYRSAEVPFVRVWVGDWVQ
jgi:hypothetical protein